MPAGRPTKYKPEYCERMIELASEGKLPMDWCIEFDVTYQSIHDWRKKHPEFAEAYEKAKQLTEACERDKMTGAESMLEFNKSKFMLSAYHRRSEVQKVEAKTETSVTNDIKISFAERD